MQCSKLDTILRQCFNLICLSTSCLQQFQRGILIPAHIKTTALQDTRIKSVLLQFFMGHNLLCIADTNEKAVVQYQPSLSVVL